LPHFHGTAAALISPDQDGQAPRAKFRASDPQYPHDGTTVVNKDAEGVLVRAKRSYAMGSVPWIPVDFMAISGETEGIRAAIFRDIDGYKKNSITNNMTYDKKKWGIVLDQTFLGFNLL